MKDKAKRDFIDRALDLNKVRGWSYDTPWLKEEWEKEKKQKLITSPTRPLNKQSWQENEKCKYHIHFSIK